MLLQESKMYLVLMIIAILTSGCDGSYPDIRAIRKNNEVSKTFKEKSIEENQLGYLEAMRNEPFQEEIHLNLGVTYEMLKDPDKALRLYKNAEEIYQKRQPPFANPYLQFLNPQHPMIILFISYFNQAQLLGRENKIDEALEKYQQALAIVPDSKEVKINIELLLQQKQNQQGGGQSENQEQNDKDQKNQSGKNDPKEGDDNNQDQDKNQNQNKNYSQAPKYKPREFKGELNKESVQKIFGEISQQEKKMRTQYSKQNQSKEPPRDKDW